MLARHRNMVQWSSLTLASYKQWTITTSQCRATIEQRISIVDSWQQCRATLRDIILLLQRRGVKLLDIEICYLKFKIATIDTTIYYRIEHKGIVWTGRYRQSYYSTHLAQYFLAPRPKPPAPRLYTTSQTPRQHD